MFICWCHEMARESGRSIHIVQPGFVNTPMGEEALTAGTLVHRILRLVKNFFAKSAWEGAQTVLHVALSEPAIPSMDGRVYAWANNALWRFWNEQINNAPLRRDVYLEVSKWFPDGAVEREWSR